MVSIDNKKYYAYLNTSDNMCRWNIAKGIIYPAKSQASYISFFLNSRLRKDKKFLELENKLELVRRQLFPNKISRLTGLFVFDSQDEAKKAEKLDIKHFQNALLSEMYPLYIQRENTRLDMNWITYHEKHKDSKWIEKYWNGEIYPNEEPIFETILNSPLIVGNLDLREAAYENIKRDGIIKDEFIFRFSVYASMFGSNLGQMEFFIHKCGACDIIKPIVNFPQEEAIRVYKLMEQYTPEYLSNIPITEKEFYSPDLSEYEFCVTHHCKSSKCPKS